MSDYDYSHTMPSANRVVDELRAAAAHLDRGGDLTETDRLRLADWLMVQANHVDDSGVTEAADGVAFRFAAGLLGKDV